MQKGDIQDIMEVGGQSENVSPSFFCVHERVDMWI